MVWFSRTGMVVGPEVIECFLTKEDESPTLLDHDKSNDQDNSSPMDDSTKMAEDSDVASICSRDNSSEQISRHMSSSFRDESTKETEDGYVASVWYREDLPECISERSSRSFEGILENRDEESPRANSLGSRRKTKKQQESFFLWFPVLMRLL